MVPCKRAWANMPMMGMTTAEAAKPKVTIFQPEPASKPKKGGRIRFPAPKKSENNANAVTSVPLLDLIAKRKFAAKDKIIMTANFNGKRVFYRDEGEGKACVLLHGFLETHKIWRPVIDAFSGHFRFIAPDFPGHGASDTFSGHDNMLDYANTVQQLLKTLDVGPALLIGHSMGGYVGLAFAKAFPQQTEGLLLLNSTPKADNPERVKIRKHGIALAKKNYPAIINMSIANLFTETYRKAHGREIAEAQQEALNTPMEGYINAQKAMMARPDTSVFWSEASFKKMMILGLDDSLINADDLKNDFNVGNIKIVTVSGGHNSLMENPDMILNGIKKFLGLKKNKA